MAADLAERGLGLSPLDHQRILDNCSHIIHCGAWVHHIYPYGRLKAANSFSTLELIKLALRGQPKKLTFVSTASAITECDAQGVGYEGQVGKHPASFFGGYAMSKWVSERLMKQAFGRGMSGLVPIVICLARKQGVILDFQLFSSFICIMRASRKD